MKKTILGVLLLSIVGCAKNIVIEELDGPRAELEGPYDMTLIVVGKNFLSEDSYLEMHLEEAISGRPLGVKGADGSYLIFSQNGKNVFCEQLSDDGIWEKFSCEDIPKVK